MPHTLSAQPPPAPARTRERRHSRSCGPAASRRRHRAIPCEWLERSLASRCDESWRRFLARYGPRIRTIIAVTGSDYGLRLRPQEVEELAQDLFLYWLRRNCRFNGRTLGELWKFILASIRHLVIDHVRYLRAEKRTTDCDPWFEPLALDDVETGRQGPESSLATSSRRTPEVRMLRREELVRLRKRLTDHCRHVVSHERDADVLVRAVLEGRSSRELSRESGRRGRPICRSTIDSWVHALRGRLALEGLVLPRRSREPEGAWPAGL